jgi:hypothetical protein
MSNSQLAYQPDPYDGIYPTVFKRVEQNDISYEPFRVYKTWTVSNSDSTSSMLPLRAIYSNPNILPALGTSLTYNDASNIDNSLQTITYYSINHLFYKYKTQPYNTFGPTDLTKCKKFLFESASILSFPSKRVGEEIKPGSFRFNAENTAGIYGSGTYGSSIYGALPISISLASDRYGNIYDTTFDTSSIVSGVDFYEGFNEYFDSSRIKYIHENLTFIPGVPTTSGITASIGLAAQFNGNGYFHTTLSGNYNRDNDYAISFFISASGNTTSNELILSKAKNVQRSQYPFKVELSGSNQIIFSVAGSTTFKTQITSSTALTGSWHHVVCQKVDDTLQLYINNTLEASVTSSLLSTTSGFFTASARIDNADNLYVGGYSTNSFNLNADLDELRIFNKSLVPSNISALTDRSEGGTFLQTNHVGNVFEKQGIAIISSADYRFSDVLSLNYTASYQSTLTKYELGVVTRLDAGDFNMSLNPSLTRDNDITYHSYVTSSIFSPYITTIGLYDDAGQLLAIGKLAQPIKKRDDVDMNFLIRIDLDKNIK